MRTSRTILLLYALIPAAFIGWNLAAPVRMDRERWPALSLVQHPTTSSTARLWKLDLTKLKATINRLHTVAFLRQAGNSLRIYCGQQLSWCIWGTGKPLMLFHQVELWASEGIEAGTNRALVDRAADRIVNYGQRLKKDGWILVVVPVPTKLSVYRDRASWPNWHKDALTRRPVPEDRASEIYSHLLQRLDAGGIARVDLASVYRIHRASHPEAWLYPPAETHWSGEGIRVAAVACADTIAAAAGVTRRDFEPSFFDVNDIGDIAAGFNPLPSWLGPLSTVYRYQDRLVNGEAGRGYVYAAQPTSLLVVTGTSYSGHYTWHTGQPVGFPWVVAGYLDNTEMHNRAVAGQGSFSSFQTFWGERHALQRDFVQRRSSPDFPRIVLWEFPLRDLASISGAELLP